VPGIKDAIFFEPIDWLVGRGSASYSRIASAVGSWSGKLITQYK